jgi:predicted GNAT family acetyltransferase
LAPLTEEAPSNGGASSPDSALNANQVEPRVVHNSDAHRYELFVGDTRVGLAVYRPEPGRIAITHTEVDPAYEGRFFGSRLAAAALDDARAHGLAVVPRCSFIATYMRRHPEYADLLADA